MRLPLFISLLIIEKVGLSATGPNFGYFLFQFEINIRNTISLIEFTDKKLLINQCRISFNVFNETCIMYICTNEIL